MNEVKQIPAVAVDTDGMLFCPACNDQYMHQRAVEVGWRHEDGPVTRHVSSPSGVQTDTVADKDVAYGYRRQYLTISLECEFCGGGFELCIYQHKGATMFKWVKLPTKPVVDNDADTDQIASDLLADVDL